jgi:hypothetical protein
VDWKPAESIKTGMLVKLYNLYRAFYYEQAVLGGTIHTGHIIGMYLETGWDGQFEFYKIAVLKDESGKGGFVQKYLTSDFSMVPLTKEEEEEYGRQTKEEL